MDNTSYDLRPLWGSILEIYDSIKDICEKNGLRYFAAFGTLIGAVRHKGFIPWDDDFDIYMPRPDYQEFICHALKELPANLAWQSVESDPNYPHRFAKVREMREFIIDTVSKQSRLKLPEGIYIDIFPLDGLPTTPMGRFFWCLKRALIRRGADDNKRFYKFLFNMRGTQQQNRMHFHQWIKSIPFDSAIRVGTTSPYEATQTPQRWWHPKTWFEGYTEVPFENRTIRIPIGTHEILTAIYGDYMKLPPEEQRTPSHQVI